MFLCPRHFQWVGGGGGAVQGGAVGEHGAYSITAIRMYVCLSGPSCLYVAKNGFRLISFEKISVLDSNFIHVYNHKM